MIQLNPLGWLYLSLICWVGLGVILGHRLPAQVPQRLGQFLFWIGVPFSIIAFLRQADLSAAIWSAPVTAWVAILLGAGLAWVWLKFDLEIGSINSEDSLVNRATQGSFLLSAMVGNTGYLGYPVALALTDPAYFGWAVFYDILGSALGSYGLGVVLAAYFGNAVTYPSQLLGALIRNPALWSFGLGLGLRKLALPSLLEQTLRGAAWTIVALSLLLLGMRLSQIRAWHNLKQAAVSLTIKMVVVPLLVGLGLPYFGIHGLARLVLVLQAGMPPAFATLVIAEAYNLDRQLTVTMLALGSVALLFLLPIWLLLFS
jgi:malate permease and related proteins